MQSTLRFRANKLVRDKTKERVAPKGITLHQRVMEVEEYLKRLQEKLVEEAHEVRELNLTDASTKQELIEELADVLEVMLCIAKTCSISLQEVELKRAQKNESHGGFDERLFGLYMDVEQDSREAEYYRARPHKYPEIELT